MRRILFCNVGWANSYHGELDDKPTGDGKYLKEGGTGHEIANFALSGDYYYGFVETKSLNGQARTIRIENIDPAAADADQVDNVLVIWCATNKASGGGKFIVGWYKDASVFRYRQVAPLDSKRGEMFSQGLLYSPDYMILCKKGNAFLVEPDQRTFKVPTARQDGYGFGQSYLWYPANNETPEVDEYIEKVLNYVEAKDADIKEEIAQIEPETSKPVEMTLAGDEKEAITKVRIGQSEYRKRLLNRWGKCQLCGLKNPSLLVASHIKPWRDSDALEKCDVNNGVMLCPNHDALFDEGLISFLDDGEIILSDRLDESDLVLLGVRAGQKIEITPEMSFYLKWHREKIFH